MKKFIKLIPFILCFIVIFFSLETGKPLPDISHSYNDSVQKIEAVRILNDLTQTLTSFSIGLFVICGFVYKEFFGPEKKIKFWQVFFLYIFFACQFITNFYGFRVRLDLITQLEVSAFKVEYLESMMLNQSLALTAGFFLVLILIFLTLDLDMEKTKKGSSTKI